MNAYIYRKMIGEHWFTTNENPQGYDECDQYLDGKIKSIPEGKSFMFLTDPHCRDTNTMNSPAIIGYVREMTGIKKVIQGGDIVHREDDRYMGAAEIIKYTNIMRSVAGEDYIPVWGNHDINTANAPEDDVARYRIPYTEIEKILYSHLTDRKCEDISAKIAYLDCDDEDRRQILALSRLHFYIDDEEAKIRYIILETGCQIEAERNGCVTKYFDVYNNGDLVMQYDWLYEVLMNTPDDYDVVVSGHAMLGYGSSREIVSGPLGVCKILSGFKTCSKVIVENPFPHYEKLAKYYAKGEHVYDFTSRKRKSNVVVIAGDRHRDIQAKADYDENGNFVSTEYQGEALSETAVIVNVVQTDAYGCTHRDEPEMKPGTNTEQCIEVVTICPDGNIKLTRIGAGQNREVRRE